MEYTAAQLIDLLGLQPHQEGGWYRFTSLVGVDIPADALAGYSGARKSASLIYYMLQRGEVSKWHTLLSDEIWVWHCGGSLEMTLGGAGDSPQAQSTLQLGPRIAQGEGFQILAPANQWQTTRVVEGDFVLVSCIVSPAYHEDDFYMVQNK